MGSWAALGNCVDTPAPLGYAIYVIKGLVTIFPALTLEIPMTTPLYRHGDVLLQATTAPTTPLHRQPHTTLAHGELTGHQHRIAEASAAELFAPTPTARPGDPQFLHVTAPHATLVHEEHAPIRLPAGWYRVWQQREYTPGSVRVVQD